VNIFVQMDAVISNILREYAGVSRLSGNITDMFEMPDRLSKDEYLDLKNIEYIDDIRFFRYNFATSFIREDIAELEVDVNIGGVITPVNIDYFVPVFVLGYNMSLLHLAPDDFKIESGRMFENDGEAVISKNSKFTPCVWNDLDLGDKIIIKNNDGLYKEFTVVGTQEKNPEDGADTNRRIIYTTLESAEYFDAIAAVEGAGMRGYEIGPVPSNKKDTYYMSDIVGMGYDVLVYLNSPESFLRLQNQMWNIEIKGFLLSLHPFFPNFRQLIDLTRVMQNNAIGFAIITGFIIICVTIISTVILLGNRKYEIAVLRSVGMKKSRLVLNYLIENLAFIWGIAVISLIIAPFIAKIFTDKALAGIREIVSTEFFGDLTQGANLDLVLPNIGLVFGGTTVIVIISLVLACINIIRFEPLKIFNKQY